MPFIRPETTYCVVDYRVLVLGLDSIYREYMKEFEAEFLLPQVEIVAAKLGISEAAVPIEGYYNERKTLTRYFKLMRALQSADEASLPLVRGLPEFQKIWNVANSPIYGKPTKKGKLLPQGRDPLSETLHDTKETGWEAEKIINHAFEMVMDSDDISLVGLGIRLKDPVTVAALRESVVLHAEKVMMGIIKYEYIWKVDEEFAQTVNRFIEEFNNLLPKDSHISNGIPKAELGNAARFYMAFASNEILGRCVNLGFDRQLPTQHYHWGITKQKDEFALDDFWSTSLWTTERYRAEQERLGWKLLKNELAKR